MSLSSMSGKQLSQSVLDALIKAGLIATLVIFSFQVFKPFLDLMLWATILAVTIYPLHRMLRPRLGNRDGRTATVIVLASILLLAVPAVMLSVSLAESAHSAVDTLKEGTLHVPPPPDSVATVPLVGKKLHAFWSQASTDLTGMLQKAMPQIREASLGMLGKLAGVGISLLIFLAALVVAGIIMAFGESGTRASIQIASRLFGAERGEHVAQLCTATIRAVAQGVIGIALIQALLVGIGFAVKGVPGTGVLTLAVLLLGIIQVPATVVTVPVIAFVIWAEGPTTAAIVFSIYTFVAGLMDNVLKPLLLGRGVAVPMPVILIGAIGGMISNGIIGLFIGPVVLAVAYELFWQWVEAPSVDAAAVAPAATIAPAATPPA